MAHHPGRTGRALTRAPGWRGVCLAAGAALMLCACASSQPSVMSSEPNVMPVNYRAEVLAYLRVYLNDPTGVRGAFITEPALRPVAGTQRYMLCLRYNAKNSVGKYEGSKDRIVAFIGGRLDTMLPVVGDQCAAAEWQAFPELEKLRR
jgi:hypothetical protein